MPGAIPAPLRVESLALGVVHPDRFACLGNWSNRFVPSSLGAMSAPESFQSRVVVVVTQPTSCAAIGKINPNPLPFLCVSFTRSRRASQAVPVFPASIVLGVGQPLHDEPESLPDMRRADARSAEIDRCEGVARSFHVSVYKVEPSEAVLARNLLTKDDWRAALFDEEVEEWP